MKMIYRQIAIAFTDKIGRKLEFRNRDRFIDRLESLLTNGFSLSDIKMVMKYKCFNKSRTSNAMNFENVVNPNMFPQLLDESHLTKDAIESQSVGGYSDRERFYREQDGTL